MTPWSCLPACHSERSAVSWDSLYPFALWKEERAGAWKSWGHESGSFLQHHQHLPLVWMTSGQDGDMPRKLSDSIKGGWTAR